MNKLCEEKGINNVKIYQNSLHWRWLRADYHAKTAAKIWEDLFNKEHVALGDQSFFDATFSYEAQVESCIQSLHSLGDILSQIINVLVLQNKYSEHDVSIKKVIDTMEKQNIASEINKSTRNLLNDNSFNYIGAFCNTIKHRRLLHTDFRTEWGENARNESGLRFEEFEFKGATYPQTWCSDILEKYRFQIFSLINEIGFNINKYIAAI